VSDACLNQNDPRGAGAKARLQRIGHGSSRANIANGLAPLAIFFPLRFFTKDILHFERERAGMLPIQTDRGKEEWR
jgi:hypothetical protein